MKQIFLGLLFAGFLQVNLHAQFFKHTLLKTRPLQNIVALNPTLGFEKPLFSKYSIELDLMYRNRVWNSSGTKGDFGEF